MKSTGEQLHASISSPIINVFKKNFFVNFDLGLSLSLALNPPLISTIVNRKYVPASKMTNVAIYFFSFVVCVW